MFTEKEIRRVIREELRTIIVKYHTQQLNEQEQESLSASGAKVTLQDFVKEKLPDLPPNQTDEVMTILQLTAAAAEAGDLAGSLEKKIKTLLSPYASGG